MLKKESIDDNKETRTHKIKVIDTYRFMHSGLSNLVDNLTEIKDNKCLDEKTIEDLIKKFP